MTAALATHCAGLSEAHGIAIACSADGPVDALDAAIVLCLYRIAQEALHNVVTHARGAPCHRAPASTPARSIELTVGDDGRGSTQPKVRKERKGLGLMEHERARSGWHTARSASSPNTAKARTYECGCRSRRRVTPEAGRGDAKFDCDLRALRPTLHVNSP